MARSVARLKMGYYPLPETEARNIRSLLSFSGPCSVVDPCAGKGIALNLITAGASVVRYGVELDTERAEEAAQVRDSDDPGQHVRCTCEGRELFLALPESAL